MVEVKMEQEFQLPEGKYITFVLGREEYGVSLNKVREILGPEGIQDSEQNEPCVPGVLKIRNQKVPVLDLRCRFGLEMSSTKAGSAVLITTFGAESVLVGLLVDSIRQVLHIKTGLLKKFPLGKGDPRAEFIMGMVQTEGREILLLNLDKDGDLLPSLSQV
jgi:purine-binding chemotaxis protein CheW